MTDEKELAFRRQVHLRAATKDGIRTARNDKGGEARYSRSLKYRAEREAALFTEHSTEKIELEVEWRRSGKGILYHAYPTGEIGDKETSLCIRVYRTNSLPPTGEEIDPAALCLNCLGRKAQMELMGGEWRNGVYPHRMFKHFKEGRRSKREPKGVKKVDYSTNKL